MQGPVGFPQTTSQASRVFSVMTTVAGITPHSSTVAAASIAFASAPAATCEERAVPPGAGGRESLQLRPTTSSSAADAPTPSHVNFAVAIAASSCWKRDQYHTRSEESREWLRSVAVAPQCAVSRRTYSRSARLAARGSVRTPAIETPFFVVGVVPAASRSLRRGSEVCHERLVEERDLLRCRRLK